LSLIGKIKTGIMAALFAALLYAVFPAAGSAHAFSSNSWATYYPPKRERAISIDGDLSDLVIAAGAAARVCRSAAEPQPARACRD